MSRVTAKLLVSALIRRVEAGGGSGMVLARGDPTSGAILLMFSRRGTPLALVERVIGLDDRYRWSAAGPANPSGQEDYIARRRRSDPDLWVVELDGDEVARIADELIA